MQATSLHDFPAELLRQVAELTHHQPSQQALRSSSKVLRDALNPRIRACTVDVTNSDAQDCSGDECAARVQAGMKQLARFPAACTLTSLSWGLDDWAAERSDEEDDYYYEHSEPDPQQVLAASILCQQVLTGFISAGGTRLSTVQRLHINVSYAVGYGEVLSITVACPSLKHLRLSYCTLVGPVFAPLARLTSFSSLDIDCTKTAGNSGPAWVPWSDSLAGLSSSLTELTFNPRTLQHDVGAHVIACIGRLTALQRLQIKFDLGENSVGMFSSLVHLRELNVPCLRSLPNCLGLACASSLTSLDLSSATLGSPAIRMLAAMPILSELCVLAFQPDCDLSGLQCGWKRVRIGSNTHPRWLLWLPLAGVDRLDVCPSWKLYADADNVCDEVRRACLLLGKNGRLGQLYFSGEAPGGGVSLSWGEPPAPAPSEAQQLAVLDALSPLQHVALGLCFDKHWDLGAEEAKALAQALPRLHTLDVNLASGLRALDFIAVLAQQGLSGLRRLHVWHVSTELRGSLTERELQLQLAAGFEGALLILAKESLLKGQALRVRVRNFSHAACVRLNQALSKAWQEAGRQGTADVFFE